MSLIRYNPWSMLDDFFENYPEKYSQFEHWVPAVDIKDEKDHYAIRVDLPGVEIKDIEIFMEANMLTIKGSRDTKSKEEKENYTRVERFSGSFMRRFTLPEDADVETIDAHSKDGVLEIIVPKQREQKLSKRIKVKIKE